MSRTRRPLVAAAIVIGAIILLVGLAPVQITANGGVSAEQVASHEWDRNAQPVPTEVVIKQIAVGQTYVLPPALKMPEVLPTTAVVTSGSFTYMPELKSYVGTGPGTLTFSCFCSDTVISLATKSTVPVEATRTSLGDAVTKTVRPPEPSKRVRAVTFKSPKAEYVQSQSFLYRSISPQFEGTGTPTFFGSIGNDEIDQTDSSTLTRLQILPVALTAVLKGVLIVLLALLVVLGFWAVGRLIDPSDDPSAPREALRTVFGAALVVILLNSMAYLVPVKWGVCALVVAVAALALFRFARRRPQRVGRSLAIWAKITAVSTVPMTVLFFPIFYWGFQFVGEYNTDLGEYSSLASLVRDHSLFEMQNLPQAQAAGVLTSGAGLSWRTVDSVTAAMLNVATGIGTVSAFSLTGIVLFFLMAIAMIGLCLQLNSRKWLVVAVAVLLSPVATGLFVEDYISHYYFIAFVPGLVLALGLLLRSIQRPTMSGGSGYLTWAAAATIAVLVAAYPYFTIIVLIALLAVAMTRAVWRRIVRQISVPVILKSLLLCNLALLTVLNYGKTTVYQDRLNEIARVTLLAPFNKSQKLELILGFLSYQFRWPANHGVDADFPFKQILAAEKFVAVNIWVPAFAFLGLVLAVGLGVAWRESSRIYQSLAAAALMVLWLLFGAYLWATHSDYAAFKTLWTFGAIAPIGFVAVKWRTERFRLVVCLMSLPVVCWVLAGVADRSGWMMNQRSDMQRASHASLATEIPEAKAALAGAKSVELVTGQQTLEGSDRDVVSTMLIAASVQDQGIRFVRASESPRDGDAGVFVLRSGVGPTRIPLSQACEKPADAIVVFGKSDLEVLCGHPLSYDGQVLQVFR